jgi:hypothetical protein
MLNKTEQILRLDGFQTNTHTDNTGIIALSSRAENDGFLIFSKYKKKLYLDEEKN